MPNPDVLKRRIARVAAQVVPGCQIVFEERRLRGSVFESKMSQDRLSLNVPPTIMPVKSLTGPIKNYGML